MVFYLVWAVCSSLLYHLDNLFYSGCPDYIISDIEVIATNGYIQKRIIWINIGPNGIYYDFVRVGEDSHSSFHRDGSLWITHNGISEKIAQFQSLDDFKGSHQLSGFNFSQDVTKLRIPDYEMKKLNAVVLLDTRTYASKTHIGCNITLLEPKRYDLLTGIETFASEIHLYTQYYPWLVISIY